MQLTGLRSKCCLKSQRRSGLAPLELVLWLPILMFVAALMVNMGTSQAWRIRGEVVARDAAWRTRWPRQGAQEPRPLQNTWPEPAVFEVRKSAEIAELQDPAIEQEVAYGSLAPVVVRQILRYDEGMLEGHSSISRPFPLLPKLGNFDSGDILHPLLDQQWQTAQMTWENEEGELSGLPANTYRRIKALYYLPEQDPSLAQAFANALQNLFDTPNYPALRVLDRDEEIRHYRGSYVDFHPRIYRRCELDPEIVRELEVERIVDEVLPSGAIESGDITCLPHRLTNFFLSMYRSEVQLLEAQIDAWTMAGGNQSSIAAAQAQIDALQIKIDQLEAYQKGLPKGCS